MEQRWSVSPEVAGELGEDTEMDSSVHPPKLIRLHHRFEGWLGDDLIECFPAFMVTERLSRALSEAELTGFSLRGADVSVSAEFEDLYPDLVLPRFYWFVVEAGASAPTDFRINGDLRLEVTERALAILREFQLEHASVELSTTAPS